MLYYLFNIQAAKGKEATPMEYKFSDKISSLKPSAIREVLKATSVPGMIPFAAGNPAPDAFPVSEVRSIAADILKNRPIEALQYGVTEGYPPLIAAVEARMKEKYNIGRDFDSVIITSGAQQVMDLSTKVLCNEGDVVICETPSFIGSLNCFRSYNARLVGVSVEVDGMNMEELEKALSENENARLIYTIPNFQNPAGVTMSLEKRKKLYELAKKYGVMILEDNPYGDLRVSGEDIPSIKSFDEDGIVIYSGSFSKILAPGIRVGFTVAPSPIIAKMTVGKQAVDVHTTQLMQMIVAEWMEKYDVDAHIEKIQGIYRKKLELMCDMIDSELGSAVSYVRPEGGLFIWCELPQDINALDFVKRSAENMVALVPGTAFLTDTQGQSNAVRLNFSTPADDKIVDGMKILGKVLREMRG